VPFASIPQALDHIRAGHMVVVVDDEDRENEGDLTIAAEHITPEAINFMATHGRGLICLAMTPQRLDELNVPLATPNNTSQFGTAFCELIDASTGVTTGISAADRARTIQVAIDPASRPGDLARPGHIPPLRAQEGGVLVRAGQTEAAVDLARMAGLKPGGVICEIMNEDGTMARRPELEVFGEKHGLRIGTIADLIEYRALHEQSVELCDSKAVNTEFGGFELHTFKDLVDNTLHYALTCGDIQEDTETLVRVQTINTLRDVLATRIDDFDKGWSYRRAMQHIADEGKGAVVLIGQTVDTEQDLAEVLQFPEPAQAPAPTSPQGMQNYRAIGTGSQILKRLGIGKMQLMSAPLHFNALSGFNLEVTDFIQP
jgi:3,4-dihydroxy 2-butanone 4-phosphate synthase/GTP cyclohydrolase II